MRTYISISIAAFVIAGGAYYFTAQHGAPPTAVGTPPAKPAAATMPSGEQKIPDAHTPSSAGITLQDVAKHASATDCWLAISGKVYDITRYIASGLHPGGNKITLGCGKDSTALFMGVEAHAQSGALAKASSYYIGDLIP